jgi:hypothetical protein
MKILCTWLILFLFSLLGACGGGGGSPGTVAGGSSGSGAGAGTGDGAAPSVEPQLGLRIVDGSGAAITTLSGGQTGVVRTTLTDASGVAVANAIVKFTTSDANLIQFTPVSASALTDAAGIAVINIKPFDFNASGALSITATAIVATKTATASTNIAVGAAPLTVGALSWTPPPAGRLQAFSTVILNIPVTSAGQPASSAPGLAVFSLCKDDGTASIVQGAIANGVQSATYTNNGCLRGTDVVTASIGSSTQTISIEVDPANIGTVRFTGTNLPGTSIVLRGSGGQGRTESALLTFKVVDRNDKGLAGVDVAFNATTTTGGLTVLPARATTDADGNVTTTVSSGTIPTPVRVIAEASRNGKTVSGLSDTLTVSTGLPIQKSMSLSFDKYNIEGLEYDGVIANITVLLADQYGNPISDSAAINFVTSGGAVGTSSQGACTTVNGGCTVQFRSQDFRSANGRVTVLAYAQGIEDFVDMNGDGLYTCAGKDLATYRPLVDDCPGGGEPFTDQGDPFLDANFDGVYQRDNGDLPFPYNSSAYRVAGNGQWGINYIRRSAEIIFSGSHASLIRQACGADPCRDWEVTDGDASVIAGVAGPGCSSQALVFRLVDVNNNPLPYATTVVGIDAVKIEPQTFFPDAVLSTNSAGGTLHTVNIKSEDACAAGSFGIQVATPKGIKSVFFFRSN